MKSQRSTVKDSTTASQTANYGEISGVEPKLTNPYLEVWKRDFSASNINKFLQCPRRWEQKYVFGREEQSKPASFLGSCFHAAVQRATLGEDAFSVFTQEFDNWKEKEVIWGDANPDTFRATGEKMLKAYANYIPQVAKAVQSFGNPEENIEKQIKFRISMSPKRIKAFAYDFLPPYRTVGFTGYIDLQTGPTSFIDIKTSGKKKNINELNTDLQFGIYSLALELMEHGKITQEASYTVEIHNITTTKDPKVTIFTLTYDAPKLELILQRIHGILQLMRKCKVFYPTYNRLCKNYCDFKGDCDYSAFVPEDSEDEVDFTGF